MDEEFRGFVVEKEALSNSEILPAGQRQTRKQVSNEKNPRYPLYPHNPKSPNSGGEADQNITSS